MIGKDNRDIATLTIPELRDEIINLTRSLPSPNNLTLVALKAAFEARIAEAQTNAATKQATAAAQQATAAQALNKVTCALFAVAAVQAALIVVQVLVSLKVIGR